MQPATGLSGSRPRLVELDEIRAAGERIADAIVHTPTLRSAVFDSAVGANTWLKAESLQRTGAFKIRGATNAVRRVLATDTTVRRFVTASSGNHAQAVAEAARSRGATATIVMPENASLLKLAETRARGAEVIQHGRFSDERKTLARQLAQSPGSYYVDPTDDADVIAGQGTIALELLADVSDIDVVVAPIGGGGLIAGISAALKRLNAEIFVLGVEPVGSASMSESLRVGAPTALEHVASVADGLLVRQPGALPFAHVQAFVDDIVLVEEDEILDAMRLLAARTKLVVEPSGAVALAAGLAGRVPRPRGDATNVAFVVSGGNVSLEPYATWLSQPLQRLAQP